MINCVLLRQEAEKYEISLDQTALDRFDLYAARLVEWNQKINLTAITDPDEILYKHFLDSLMLFHVKHFPENSKVIDIGTGAGFPGLVLKIARPDLDITLLDGTKKRLNVIDAIQKDLGLSTTLLHLRAEEGGKNPNYREQFDFATARAVTNLPVLAELCIPYVKVNGYFLPMKGPDAEQEIKNTGNALQLLGSSNPKITEYSLSSYGERKILSIKKIKATPKKYPRAMGKIKKDPLH